MQKEIMEGFFAENLVQMQRRLVAENNNSNPILLNKNELPFEMSKEVKKAICNELINIDWNRYPTPYYPDLEEDIARYANIDSRNIVVGAGAAYLISLLLNTFAKHQIIIPNPSFSLFKFHCTAYGLNYIQWDLNENLEYEIDTFPKIKQKSVIIIDSPNNPAGCCVTKEQLEFLLKQYSDSIFIIDEVYFEFSKITFKDLVTDYENIIIIRSFSKAFGLAGVRIGYLITSEVIANQLKKLVLPFVLNHFSYITAKFILNNESIIQDLNNKLLQTLSFKQELIDSLENISEDIGFKMFTGNANFFLMKFNEERILNQALKNLNNNNISILNVSMQDKLKNCIRVSIGKQESNLAFLHTIKSIA